MKVPMRMVWVRMATAAAVVTVGIIRGGERIHLQPAATSGHGTDIKISELFFNMPARKKFLKSNTTELNQVVEAFLVRRDAQKPGIA